MRYLGIDLAWGEGTEQKPANRSGVVALEPDGTITDAGWTTGLRDTVRWIQENATPDTLLFVDAPLRVENATSMRDAERQVGQRYGTWWVSANSTNTSSPRQAGVKLLRLLEAEGWTYDDGRGGPSMTGRVVSECYPYTAIVGAPAFGYDDKRPAYKRLKKGLPAAQAWPIKTEACDVLIARVAGLSAHEVPMDLVSHPTTRTLIDEPSPRKEVDYKQREDLLDAAICAWTAALWHQQGTDACQVLGETPDSPADSPIATIIAPARPSQRRPAE